MFIHRQTKAQTSRFTTTELKELETHILNAFDDAIKIEIEIFNKFIDQVTKRGKDIQNIVNSISELDIAIMVADQSNKRNYVCPNILNEKRLEINGIFQTKFLNYIETIIKSITSKM